MQVIRIGPSTVPALLPAAVLFATVALATAGPQPALAQGPPPAAAEEARALIRDVLSESGYQTELPGAEEAGASRSPWDRKQPRPRRHRLGFPLGAGLGGLLKLVSWIFLAGVLAAVLVSLTRWVVERSARRGTGGQERGGPDGGGAGRGGEGSLDLGEIDRLAEEGQFEDAVHLLLLRALAMISRGRAGAFSASATSREILRSEALAPGERPLLERLVEQVERSLFGGATIGPEEFRGCRKAFQGLEARR